MKLPNDLKITFKELEDECFECISDKDDDEVIDIVSDYLSDTYGYCHEGFEGCDIDRLNKTVSVSGILWDTSD